MIPCPRFLTIGAEDDRDNPDCRVIPMGRNQIIRARPRPWILLAHSSETGSQEND